MRELDYICTSKIAIMITETISTIGFDYSETHKMVAASAREFAEQHIRPHVMEWDESQTFPLEVFKKAGEMGFMGVLVPAELGGSGLGYHEYIAILEEISRVDPSIGLSVAAHNSLCTNHILSFGNEEQKQRWIPKLATAEWIGAWGLTEHNTGSDAAGMSTTAIQDGDDWMYGPGCRCAPRGCPLVRLRCGRRRCRPARSHG